MINIIINNVDNNPRIFLSFEKEIDRDKLINELENYHDLELATIIADEIIHVGEYTVNNPCNTTYTAVA